MAPRELIMVPVRKQTALIKGMFFCVCVCVFFFFFFFFDFLHNNCMLSVLIWIASKR